MRPTSKNTSTTNLVTLLSILTGSVILASGCGTTSNAGAENRVSPSNVTQTLGSPNSESNSNPLGQPLNASSLSQGDEMFVNDLSQSFFPSVDQEASQINQIMSDFDQQSQLTDQERQGYANALAGALNELAALADLSDHAGGNMTSSWLGTDNPSLSNSELKSFALDVRQSLEDLETNCGKLSSMLSSEVESV